ncbi:MAG: YfiR family protein [Verrucomicrobia bacterium]|nr:YfiR family protein [Verrucomicrobiota bacterium]
MAAFAASAGAQSGSAPSPSAVFSADAVKAAYIINFIRFTEWPSSSGGASFVIGIAGNHELEDQLWKVADGKLVQGRTIRVRRLTTIGDVSDCQVIYVQAAPPRSEAVVVTTEEWLAAVRGKAVLTVASEPGFLNKGGIINFYAEGNNLRFEIAPRTAESVGLRLSSRLLALARIVNPTANVNPPSQ